MTRPAGIWIGALVGSASLHVALFAGLLFAIRPDPTVDQQEMHAVLDVDAYRLDRQQAVERPAEGQKALQGDSQGAFVAEGGVPQSRARETLPEPELVRTRDDAGDTLAAADVAALRLAPSTGPSGVLNAARPSGRRAKAVAARVTVQRPARVPVATVAPTAVATTDRIMPALAADTAKMTRPAALNAADVPVADAAVAKVANVRPEVENALTVQPAPFVAPRSEPDAKTVKAALAFTGGDGNIDPTSLAAFQSFMSPGDAITEGDPLRDGIAGLLAAVPCSRLQVSFDPATTTLQVNGHVPEDALRAPILAALQSQMGTDIGVSDNILILPRPQCGALAGIASVGLPQSTDQSTNPLLIGEDTHARIFRFVQNDRLFFDITAPDYDAYIYVDYFDAGGNVLHLVPNDQVALTFAPAQSAQRVGAESAQDAGLQIRIGPPYGQEIAVAFAASQPLYDGLRPLVEPAGPYLDWLRLRIETIRDGNPDFRGEWVYFFVATSER